MVLRVASTDPEPTNSIFYPFLSAKRLFKADSSFLPLLLCRSPPLRPPRAPHSSKLYPPFVHLCLLLQGVRGVMPSIAMLRHFLYLRVNGHHPTGCPGFIVAHGSNVNSRAGKKVENIQKKWVLLDAKCSNELPAMPTGIPTSEKGWSSEKINDP